MPLLALLEPLQLGVDLADHGVQCEQPCGVLGLGTGYVVELPGGVVARCNPVTAPPDCDDELLAGER